jgi:CoA:oxalate CoA-transferase
MEEILRCRTARDWELILGEAGVPCAVVGTVTEAVNNPQLKSRNMIVSAGKIKMAGNPIKINTLLDPPVRNPAPDLDADGARIRAEFCPKTIDFPD